MARLNGNGYFVSFDGVDLSAHTGEDTLKVSNEDVDVTAGANKTHVEIAGGLDSTSGDLMIAYEVGSVSGYIQKLKPGLIGTFEFGPEGNTSGKPRHVQSMKVNSVEISQDSKKKFVMFTLSLVGAEAPSVNMFAGGVYS